MQMIPVDRPIEPIPFSNSTTYFMAVLALQYGVYAGLSATKYLCDLRFRNKRTLLIRSPPLT